MTGNICYFSKEVKSLDKISDKHLGEDSERDTPVPISNTEVKSFSADGTMVATPWESRYSPVIFLGSSMVEHPAVNR